MPSKVYKVQVALQGGGAKIVLLLAAAEALQELEGQANGGPIKITQIAGTSAGAIVGALLAAKCPISEARLSLAGSEGSKLLGKFSRPWFFVALWKAWRGNPFWSDRPLADWLRTQLGKSPLRKSNGAFRIKDLADPALKIVSSDLTNPGAGSYGPDDDLLQALLDSAALPFCFRTWRSDGNHRILVDGGLCENLPVDQLQIEDEVKGPVIAFSFDESPAARPDGMLNFGLALLNTAISHSVQSSQTRLEEDSVFSLSANPEVTTFDFERAQAFLNGAEYAATKKKVRDWILKFVARHSFDSSQHVTNDVWRRPSGGALRNQMRRIGHFYHEVHEPQKIRFVRATMIVTANSLAQEGNEAHGRPDQVLYEIEIEPHQQPIFAHRLSLSSPKTSSFFGHYSLDVRDSQNNKVEFQALASIAPDDSDDRQLVVFFTPPLQPGSGAYKITLQDSGEDLLAPLRADREDKFLISFKRAIPLLGRVEVALHVPQTFPLITMAGSNVRAFAPATINFQPPPDFVTFAWSASNFAPPVQDDSILMLKMKW